ncbi:MAG: 6-carboxytetrahydropterin synthase [Gammaproteobacteria bacterium]|nr:6-carboxytetrahydropterin synthase [Gammaproteobacteria bacterium]
MTGHDMRNWMIHIRKDTLKFAAAHMTVFPDGSKEHLHGHNYQVELAVELTEPALPQMLSYEVFKQALRTVCAEWDEKLLIAGNNPWLEILPAESSEYAFRLCGKRYVLPVDEVVVLAIDNVTAENLAQALFERFWAELTHDRSVRWRERIVAASLRIDESPGQGATYTIRWG